MQVKDNGRYNEVYGKTLIGHNLMGVTQTDRAEAPFYSTNPACYKDLVAVFPLSTQADLDAAIAAAHEAFKTWQYTPVSTRKQILAHLEHLLEKHIEDLAKLMVREVGKPFQESLREIQEAIDSVRLFHSQEWDPQRQPLGVAAVITAPHFPIADPASTIIPALFSGNTLVWKPSEEAPALAYVFGELLGQAGVPKGVINIIHGDAHLGSELVQQVTQGQIQHISFTGSADRGHKIAQICEDNLIPSCLTLRGKNAFIVMPDADLDLAVKDAVCAAYLEAGQRYTSTNLLILHKDIAETFRQKFVAAVKDLKIGDPSLNNKITYGPLISKPVLDTFMAHYLQAKKEGAELLYGNGRITRDSKPQNFVGDPDLGLYVWPVIWDKVKLGMKIAQTTLLGPMVCLIEVESLEDALQFKAATQTGHDRPLGACIETYTKRSESKTAPEQLPLDIVETEKPEGKTCAFTLKKLLPA